MSAHVYDGPAPDMQHNVPCDKCGYPPRHGNHLANGGVVCDMEKGACSCGASHDLAETKARIAEANKL